MSVKDRIDAMYAFTKEPQNEVSSHYLFDRLSKTSNSPGMAQAQQIAVSKVEKVKLIFESQKSEFQGHLSSLSTAEQKGILDSLKNPDKPLNLYIDVERWIVQMKNQASQAINPAVSLIDAVSYKAVNGMQLNQLARDAFTSTCLATLNERKTSASVELKTIQQVWNFYQGDGLFWIRDTKGKERTYKIDGVFSTIVKPGQAFQIKNTGDSPLRGFLIDNPPWPGMDEVKISEHKKW